MATEKTYLSALAERGPCQAEGRNPCPNKATGVEEGVVACDECRGELVEDRRAMLADRDERGYW